MLPRAKRISREREIKQILKKKQLHFSSPLLYMVAEETSNPTPRVAVICSGRLGSAVVRNRTRRVVLAAVLRNWHKIKRGLNILIYPKVAGLSLGEYEQSLSNVLKGMGNARAY